MFNQQNNKNNENNGCTVNGGFQAGGHQGAWGVGGQVSCQKQVAPNTTVHGYVNGSYGGNKHGSQGQINGFGAGFTHRF